MSEEYQRPDTGAEAPASFNVKVNFKGWDVMITVRDGTVQGLIAKLDYLIEELPNRGAVPQGAQRWGAAQGPVQPPQQGPPPQPWQQPQQGQQAGYNPITRNPICPIHGVEMTPKTRQGDTWYSHPMLDGSWCKGK